MGFASRKLLAKSRNVEVVPPTSGDLYWGDAVLLLHADKSNNQTNNSFLDSSTNNFTITRNGTPTQGSFTPFLNNYIYDPLIHGGSAYFNGTTDYLSVPDNDAFHLTGDFTIEAWVYQTSSKTATIIGQWGNPGVNQQSYIFRIDTNGKLSFAYADSPTTGVNSTPSSSGITYNSWNHVAFVRSGNTVRYYINGVQDSVTNTVSISFINASYPHHIGLTGSAAGTYFNGYISNLRIVKGLAVYTSNFTPPTSPVTLTSNGGATPSTAPTSGQVSLLCDFTNAGIFDSTKKNNLITAGDAKVSNAVVKYGSGAMYFDGAGDVLYVPHSNNLIFGSSDFTIEFWVYHTNISGTYRTIFSKRPTTSAAGGYKGIVIDLYNGNYNINITFNGSTWAINPGNITPAVLNTWEHIALVRSGSTFTFYKNGVNLYTTTNSGTIFDDTVSRVTIGADSESTTYYMNGYLDDLRITKGVARYTSNFTPPGPLPDGPLTALATTLELNDFSGYIVQEDSSYILLDT